MAASSNPNIKPFGSHECTLRGLSAMEQAELGPHERIQRVWGLMLRLSASHAAKLQKLGILISVEDLLQDVALALLLKDHLWQPERAKYTTFATWVWRSVRQRYDESRGVIQAPHNAWSNLKKLRAQYAQGRLASPSKIQTMMRLDAVQQLPVPLEEER